MSNRKYFFICKNSADYENFQDHFCLKNESQKITINPITFEYSYCSENSTIIIVNKKKEIPRDYFFEKAIEFAEQIIKLFNKQKIIDENDSEYIFVVHWGGQEALEQDLHLKLNLQLKNNGNNKLRFASFTHSYYNKIKTFDGLLEIIHSQIDEKVFDSFEYDLIKKNLINLWLPLAIDIQGLSEVQNDTENAPKYFEEIKKETEYLASLSSFPNNKEGKNQDFPRWDEIKKNELKNGYKDFNLVNLVEELTNKDFNSFKTEKKKYLDSKIGDNPNPNFLPNWLQEVVNILDKKIKPPSSEKSK